MNGVDLTENPGTSDPIVQPTFVAGTESYESLFNNSFLKHKVLEPGTRGFLVMIDKNIVNKTTKIGELYDFFEKFSSAITSKTFKSQTDLDNEYHKLGKTGHWPELNGGDEEIEREEEERPSTEQSIHEILHENDQLPQDIFNNNFYEKNPRKPPPATTDSKTNITYNRRDSDFNLIGLNCNSSNPFVIPVPGNEKGGEDENKARKEGEDTEEENDPEDVDSTPTKDNVDGTELAKITPNGTMPPKVTKHGTTIIRTASPSDSFASSTTSFRLQSLQHKQLIPTVTPPSTAETPPKKKKSRAASNKKGSKGKVGAKREKSGDVANSNYKNNPKKQKSISVSEPTAPSFQTKKIPKRMASITDIMAAAIPPNINALFRISDLNDQEPFRPRITAKMNGMTSFSLQKGHDFCTNSIYYENPYKIEIERWLPYPNFMRPTVNISLKRLGQTSTIIVHTETNFQLLMKELQQVPEFAFGSLSTPRSYYGFTCVIQISTRNKDFVMDCFGLVKAIPYLNAFFTHPNILKVGFNAQSSVELLQKDFGIYVVGLYDVMEAEKIIDGKIDRKSAIPVDAVIQKYVNTELDFEMKKHDWRLRPLSKALIDQARGMTHYLLKIKDLQTNFLLKSFEPEKLYQIFEASRDIAKSRFQQPNRTQWLNKYKLHLSNQQMYALTELNAWRTDVAWAEDEGVHWVASTKALACIAKNLPNNSEDLVKLADKNKFVITAAMKRDMTHIVHVLTEAKDLPLIKCKSQDVSRKVVSSCLQTKCPSLLFFKAKTSRPAQIVYKIMEEYQDTRNFGCPNYVQRILPVDQVCENDLDKICQAVEEILDSKDNHQRGIELYEISSNFKFNKQFALVSAVQRSVQKLRPHWTYREEDSGTDLCILIFALRSLCCVSLVNHYRSLREFYLR